MQMSADPDYIFKILILGDAGAGKSSLLLRYTDDMFCDSYMSTVGVDFKFKTVQINGKIVKLQIWDTAGQERYRNITSSYYRGALGIVLVYDVTNTQSYRNLDRWVNDINTNISDSSPITVMIGNKTDAVSQRVVPFEDAKSLADSQGMCYFETSAKTADNVATVFENLVQQIYTKKILIPSDPPKYKKPDEVKKKNRTCVGLGDRGCTSACSIV
eukprot:TRINITY_DN3651_c0_g1_i1.p1 TRINITY_DN3651_c0_g1~~TRINITY_DN3651_c0_g1_i1.p1  ORF type:complete len:215 (+),score=37.69 TRINITY_DN3651_c0_g1_i1:132-776(+)